ncbi:unnamed protein product [Tuber aestivum]|uniref:UvrD-like helicase ATP-binding domain-containing protein n=1 Tax=Tuber aestivum TaxID=59557 RepID=A0A292PLI7_9PEZI|nr:unnamed protein product [Tuber aestivum]
MDSSTGFFQFIFSERPRDFKAAYESLDHKPYQIFDILLSEERFKNFFSRTEVYGANLANLLTQFPNFQKDNYRSSLLREIIRAFTLSLLTETFDDAKSSSAIARILVSVVKLSDPSTLGKFGVRLGALPGILRILIEKGHIRELTRTHKQCFEGLISESQAREQWVRFIMDLCKDCGVHGSRPKRIGDVELAKFIRTVPCEFCPDISSNRGLSQTFVGEPSRARRDSYQPNTEPNALEHLLGEPLGPWKIILSQRAMEDLEEVNGHGDFESVRRKLYELASGDWAGEKILLRETWGNALGYRIPLFRALYAGEHYILWQIDAEFDERFGEDYQVIKVWAVGKPPNVDRIGAHVRRAQQPYTEARVEACSLFDGSRGIRYPARVFLDGEEEDHGYTELLDGTSDDDFGDSAQLAKFYSLTTTVLDNIAAAPRRVAYPVAISKVEAEVVDHFATPAFILGRSGTGKTTCLVYKLVGRYLSSRKNGEPLRQVLLTKSKRLASKLRTNTGGLIEAKLGEMNEPAEGNCGKNGDFDDNTKQQFSSLGDADFPLVCTFDYLLSLIENSIRAQETRGRYMKMDSSKCAREIDFRKFSIEYWERVPPKLKKRIPKGLAFLEIMGVIKGSVTPAADFEPLSRGDYLGKRWRLAPNFATEQERSTVYDIYEWYERAKKKRGDIDQADRVIKVIRTLEAFKSSEISEDIEFERNIRRILHEIYVDEVQDQRTSEIDMLLTLVEYPRRIHFAGDAAQCISKDALFRFENAKALFYERFRGTTSSTRDLRPTLKKLLHNFRSHKQILSVASLVMDLLYGGFPELVDELRPEIGKIPGPKPTLYIGDNIIENLKIVGGMGAPQTSDNGHIKFQEYGEVRVILVRDEETRDKLRTELGSSWLVLTILQSKGMEFEDVFLYNFLSTASYSGNLDILEDLFKRRYLPVSKGSPPKGYSDWVKNNIALCSELKNLYVGVTRARNRLWILESNTCDLGPVVRLFNQTANQLRPRRYPEPILEILAEQDIGVCPELPRLSTGRTISASRWREMGYQMIDDQQYPEALRCFEQAEYSSGITLTNAYINEEIGHTNRAHQSFEVANGYFMKASELFLQAGSVAKAVQCRKEGGDLKGAAEILADNGEYEDAAWLSAELGLFSKASEVYTKLGKHGKALAGYARGKRFASMLDYLERFKSEIEPCCWKQYVQLLYLGEFGESDTIPDEHEKRVLNLMGSLKEKEMVFSRIHLMNKLFDLLSANSRYMKAYEVGVSSGLLGSSIRLLGDKIWLKNPNWGQGAQLNVMCKYLQAEHIATNSWLGTGEDKWSHEVLRAVTGRGSPQIDSFVRMWGDISQELNTFVLGRCKTTIAVGRFDDPQIAGYVDILVTRSTYANNEFRLPLDHIERVLEDLRIISSHGAIPSPARLYCGIYEMPRQPGKHVVLDWSPLRENSKPRLPLRPVDLESLRGGILRLILRDISSLVSLEEELRIMWGGGGGPQFLPPLTPGMNNLRASISFSTIPYLCEWNLAETHCKKVELLVRLCLIFSEYAAMTKCVKWANDSAPQNWNQRFWATALLEQMEFKSSYEQNIGVLLDTKSELKTQMKKYRVLCSGLCGNDITEHRIESAVEMGLRTCVSSLLAQYQTSLFLDYRGQWMKTFLAMRTRLVDKRSSGFRSGSEMVTLVNRLVLETEAGDFPGRFCENIYRTLGALARLRNALNFYLSSVISLYEELTLSLIFLVRPYQFLIPDSWHRLYFNRWERKHRSPSVLECFLYQQCLAKVCLSFCEMVINIEGKGTSEIALGRRSVNLIVVCLINLGTFYPRPQEYRELWKKSQEVFCCGRLNISGIRELPEDELIVHLAKAFRECGGSDTIRLVRGHQRWVDSFAGIPLKENGISVVRSSPVKEKKRHLWGTSECKVTRLLNAAYILTAFWKLNGPRYVEKMKVRRQRYAARILTAFWRRNGPSFLKRMEERRRQVNAARIVTAFWKLNGRKYVEKMKGRRQRHAARILTAFWRRNGPRILERLERRRRELNAARKRSSFWKLDWLRFFLKR